MMSQEEKDKLSTIERDVNAIKRWWPVIAAIFSALWLVVKFVSWTQSTYDNEVAKKSDLKPIIAQQEIILNQQRQIIDDIKDLKSDKLIVKSTDSLSKSNKRRLDDHIRYANQQFKKLTTTIAFYTEHYSLDANGKRVFKVIPHQQ